MSAGRDPHVSQCHRHQSEYFARGTPIALCAGGLGPLDVIGREPTVFPAGVMEQIRESPGRPQVAQPLTGAAFDSWRNLVEPAWIADHEIEVVRREQGMAGFDGYHGALHQLRRPARATQCFDANELRRASNRPPSPLSVSLM